MSYQYVVTRWYLHFTGKNNIPKYFGYHNAMKSYKSCLVLVLLPYIALVVVFHTQIQLYEIDKTQIIDRQNSDKNNRNQEFQEFEYFRDRNSSKKSFTKNGKRKIKTWDKKAIHDDRIYIKLDNDPDLVQYKQNRRFNFTINKIMKQKVTNSPGFKYIQPEYCQSDKEYSESPSVPFQPLFKHFIYTAYYDVRNPDQPAIRIFSILHSRNKPLLFCHIAKNHKINDDDYVTVIPTFYEMCENHGKTYGGWIISCEIPNSVVTPPCFVILSVHPRYISTQPNNFKIPVFLLESDKVKKQDFAICVPPLFGYVPSTTVIEFVELSILLGVNHINFYAQHIPRPVEKVLQYYETLGMVSVVPWNIPVPSTDVWYHGQLLSINDCLYRNMHRFNYIAFNDIDEFIVPHKHSNWSDMMHFLKENGTQFAGFSFQSAFFDPLIESSNRVLYDLESDLRTKTFSKVRKKVLVEAYKIHELGIHHVSKIVSDKYEVSNIEPEVAFIHHYRKCIVDYDPSMRCQVFARDESVLRYIPNLRHSVHQTMWVLKETDRLTYRNRYRK